ncbi:GNAT family N-acetyltransferase [Mesonia sediminis]|uniref:GNAT family N-acetyltransferase n=1 Tax=Mesonia sediminis TaxID=1703946 RepID=A0ABW5SG60_9FLAO
MLSNPEDTIYLRALEPEDLDFIEQVENDSQYWHLSGTQKPFSRYILKQYLAESHRDIYEVKQLRLVISLKADKNIGLLDFYDFDPQNRRVALGVIIFDPKYRQSGYAYTAVKQACEFAQEHLKVHQIYAGILADNHPSIQLFEKLNFKRTGVQKDWVLCQGTFKDQYLYQLINHVY